MNVKTDGIIMTGHSKSKSAMMAKQLLKSNNAELTKTFVNYTNNSKWLAKNRPRLRKKFGNTYVAIHNGEVCLHDENLSKLREAVLKKYRNNQQSVVVDYIGKRRLKFLL